MVRDMGYYSNVCRGRRKRQGEAESEYVIEDEEYNKGCSRTLARLIKKILDNLNKKIHESYPELI